MSGYRFYPLAGFPMQGILVTPRGTPKAAEFISVERAKAEARRKTTS